jgi:hypothetical protein
MDRSEEMLRLLENVVTELQHIKQIEQNGNAKLDVIIANQTQELIKLDTIIQNTAPQPGDDITSLGGSISTPVKK